MIERPILFSGPMVQAILEGRKTQTRRVVRFARHWGDAVSHNDLEASGFWWCAGTHWQYGDDRLPDNYHKGMRLYVRETWAHSSDVDGCGLVCYWADWTAYNVLYGCHGEGDPCGHGWLHCDPIVPWDEIKWKPSIHMPRWASRITLEITDVRVERLQEISEEDAISEWDSQSGVVRHAFPTYIDVFHELWDELYEKRGCGWDANPWVWVIEFQRVEEG